MRNSLFSSLTRKERFRAIAAIVVTIAAILLSVGYMGILLYSKVHPSTGDSKQPASPATQPVENADRSNLPSPLNIVDATSTNATTFSLAPIFSDTGTN
jgi:cytochrome bd-type quinol oxidase subunit 2